MPKETSAGAVIFRGKPRKYLLLHYEAGHWDFVKGNVEKGERVEDTIKREGKEETGIKDLQFSSGFKEKIHYFYRKGGELISKEVIFLLAETKQEKIKLSHEHIGYVWLEYNEALKQLTYNTAKNVLKMSEGFLKKRGSETAIITIL